MSQRLALAYFIVISLLAAFHPGASAEYRAYELLIRNTENGKDRTVLSTLDHIQYPGYHPLAAVEQISYLDSWMCWGNTSAFQAICPKPQIESAERRPSSEPVAP